MAWHIGTSGWSYDHWQGVLYPPGTPRHDRLAYLLARFPTVELNASFYRWPADATFRTWSRRLPPGFQMSVKAARGLTHGRQLYGPEAWLARMGAGLRRLGERQGVTLVQLPPSLARDDARLDYFLARASAIGRVAVELRHPSWHVEEIFGLLERHGAAYCVMSGAGLPCVPRATTSFVYARLHGPDPYHLYGGSYTEDDLRWWADRVREWDAQGRDVYLYFNNDGDGHAVRNADRLATLLWG